MKVIILAGGCGTRLWPLSRDRYPKQFVKIKKDDPSLFQETFERSLLISEIDDIYVVTNEKYKFLVMGAIEELGYEYNEGNIFVEPEAKNTLPAVYAGVNGMSKGIDDTIVVFPSDHRITKPNEFSDIIKESESLAKKNIITFGIKPDGPNTGYGYISSAGKKMNGYVVEKFHEKPDYDTAVSYIEKGYFWNSGIFMFNSELFVNEVKIHAPEIYDAFDSSENINTAFSKIHEGVSMDYGIMEKSNSIAVVPVDIGWNDLGSFDAFYDVYEKDENNNIVESGNIVIDSKNNYIYSETGKLVASVGVEDLIIVDNRDALLICKKDQSQKVKQIVETLNERKDSRAKSHVKDYRPWGNYKVLEEEKDSFKINRVVVGVGKKLSYQLHYHRSEHWVVVKGMAKVIIEGVENLVSSGESIFIRPGQRHKLENPGRVPLEIIEVQMGEYLEENDIVRFEDEYRD
jgi:mannose-1-phosphate guanylyltransferase/mannose-6-phosphate isomerase